MSVAFHGEQEDGGDHFLNITHKLEREGKRRPDIALGFSSPRHGLLCAVGVDWKAACDADELWPSRSMMICPTDGLQR